MKYLVKTKENFVYNEEEKRILEEYGFKFRIKETEEEAQKRIDNQLNEMKASCVSMSCCIESARNTYEIIGYPELLKIEVERLCNELEIDECLLNWKEREFTISLNGFYAKDYDEEDCEDEW